MFTLPVSLPAILAAAAAAGVVLAPAAPADPVQEDDPEWFCVTMGDHVCGPHNANGVTPGLYADGVLVASWPTAKTCRNVGGDLLCDEAFLSPADAARYDSVFGPQR